MLGKHSTAELYSQPSVLLIYSYFAVLEFELKSLILARQVLYHLSHSVSPQCFIF
jgi:hypothetical protein